MIGINSFQLTVDPWLCRMEFQGFRKSHRKSRINKKWHKKYGAIMRCTNVAAYQFGRRIISCPCVIERIKKRLGGPPT